MWQKLMDWLPDVPVLNSAWNAVMDLLPDLKVGTFEIRDLLNLVVASLATYLAYLAIQMGRKQGEIAETQHEIMRQQLARKAVMVMLLGDPLPPAAPYVVKYRVIVANVGNKTVSDYYWEVLCTQEFLDNANLHLLNAVYEVNPTEYKGVQYRVLQRHSKFPIYGGRDYELGVLELKTLPSGATPEFLWKLDCEDGQFPEDSPYGVVEVPMPALPR